MFQVETDGFEMVLSKTKCCICLFVFKKVQPYSSLGVLGRFSMFLIHTTGLAGGYRTFQVGEL